MTHNVFSGTLNPAQSGYAPLGYTPAFVISDNITSERFKLSSLCVNLCVSSLHGDTKSCVCVCVCHVIHLLKMARHVVYVFGHGS